MGIVFSDFFRKKTNAEKLELVFYQMQLIEEYKTLNQLRRKKVLSAFIFYSYTAYVTAIVVVYLYFFPEKFKYRAYLVGGLVSVPFLIIAFKNFLSWYYEKKVSSNESKLTMLRNQRNELIEIIKKTETYSKAKEILSKFAPHEENEFPSLSRTYSNPDLKSALESKNTTPVSMPLLRDLYKRNVRNNTEPSSLNSTAYGSRPQPVTQSPYPILRPSKSLFDNVINTLIGDGAKDRFALICKKCAAHNGMVLSEEFEYTSFRCCFCYTLNASRKQRPTGAKLEETTFACSNVDDQKNKSTAAVSAYGVVKGRKKFNQTGDSDMSGNQENCNDGEADDTKNHKKIQKPNDKSHVRNSSTDES